jgi:hypothetical protein
MARWIFIGGRQSLSVSPHDRGEETHRFSMDELICPTDRRGGLPVKPFAEKYSYLQNF